MSGQVTGRERLGELTRIGQGGQGVVYRAPNVKTKFASSMVYKEYKPHALAEIDFAALASMPALVEDSLTYAQAERLVSVAAWPCALVQDGGASTGFVMPSIPDEFFIQLTTVKGVSSTTSEVQHLLNHASVLAARGIDIDDVQRFSLLREAASVLAFLHKLGVCVGDISPKNLLFCLTPQEAVYFIDCDAMRISGVSALPQVQTPGWETPASEELATVYSDAYKLGLLALRMLAGDQNTTNPDHLPSTTPAMLRQLITDTLTNPPQSRPLPESWTYVLGHAIEHAQHDKPSAEEQSTPQAAESAEPAIPVVRKRPTPTPKPTVAKPKAPTPATAPKPKPSTYATAAKPKPKAPAEPKPRAPATAPKPKPETAAKPKPKASPTAGPDVDRGEGFSVWLLVASILVLAIVLGVTVLFIYNVSSQLDNGGNGGPSQPTSTAVPTKSVP